jgi:hypothetical protein
MIRHLPRLLLRALDLSALAPLLTLRAERDRLSAALDREEACSRSLLRGYAPLRAERDAARAELSALRASYRARVEERDICLGLAEEDRRLYYVTRDERDAYAADARAYLAQREDARRELAEALRREQAERAAQVYAHACWAAARAAVAGA